MNSRGRLTVKSASNTPTYAQTIPRLSYLPTTTIFHALRRPSTPSRPRAFCSSAFGRPLIPSGMRLTASPMPFNSRLPVHLAPLHLLAASPVNFQAFAPASTLAVVKLAPPSSPTRSRRRPSSIVYRSPSHPAAFDVIIRQDGNANLPVHFSIPPTSPSSRPRPLSSLRRPSASPTLAAHPTFLSMPPHVETATSTHQSPPTETPVAPLSRGRHTFSPPPSAELPVEKTSRVPAAPPPPDTPSPRHLEADAPSRSPPPVLFSAEDPTRRRRDGHQRMQDGCIAPPSPDAASPPHPWARTCPAADDDDDEQYYIAPPPPQPTPLPEGPRREDQDARPTGTPGRLARRAFGLELVYWRGLLVIVYRPSRRLLILGADRRTPSQQGSPLSFRALYNLQHPPTPARHDALYPTFVCRRSFLTTLHAPTPARHLPPHDPTALDCTTT
ncbi:hypothetical protein FB451DRAFT_1409644 [Mycena latifolia]|nr:hypothetical protein FB451DRAFT_1409644 [Mycena latifolia]